MAKKKQGFIDRHFIKPVRPLGKIFGFIPQILPFVSKQKVELDKWSEVARERLKNPAQSNFVLGKEFFGKNNIGDAVTRFKIAVYLKKDYSEAYFWLGKSYLIQSKIAKAKAAFEKAKEYKLKSEEFDYLYNVYNKQKGDVRPSAALYKLYFDKFSEVFDEYYVESFEYKGIEKVASLFTTHNDNNKASILDLGCGSGFLGKNLKEQNNNFSVTGLDFSTEMLNSAKQINYEANEGEEVIDLSKDENKAIESKNKVYDFLVKTDLLQYQNSQETKYDAILARGIFNYIKEPKEALKNLKSATKKDGLLIFYTKSAFSKEQLKEIEEQYSFPFFCNHYAHSETDIKKACKDNSFKLVTSQDFKLEKDSKATIYVFKRS